MRGIAAKRGAGVAALCLLAVTLLLGGCVPAPSASHRSATQTPAWSPPPTTTPSPTPPPTRSFQQAWGNAAMTRLPTGLSSNQYIFQFANAATPDGQWLIGEVTSRHVHDATGFTPYLAAYNIHTRQIVRVHALSAPERGVNIVATDGTWFVWQEGNTRQEGVTDGVIRVYNWRTGAYRQYTQAMLGSLVVENGKSLWSQITPNEPNAAAADQTAIVRLADLNAGTVATVATNATGAALAWPWVGWGVQTDSSGGGYLQFKNLVTGQTTQSTPVVGQSIQGLAYSLTLRGVTAFTISFGSEVDEIPDVSRSATLQMIFDNHQPGIGPLSISGRLVAWGMSAGPPIPLVFDSIQHALVTLPATTASQTYAAWTGDGLLVWYDSVSPAQRQADQTAGLQSLDTLCVVDTSALPTAPPA